MARHAAVQIVMCDGCKRRLAGEEIKKHAYGHSFPFAACVSKVGIIESNRFPGKARFVRLLTQQ